jgi:hypothetical protein
MEDTDLQNRDIEVVVTGDLVLDAGKASGAKITFLRLD